MKPIHHLRENYHKGDLDITDILHDPIAQFKVWFEEARQAGLPEPNAMTLCTVDGHNRPSSRVVLLKEATASSFIFYTNYGSDKSKDINHNPHVSLNFLWLSLERQIQINGKASKITREQSEQYFHSRPRESQIGAWVSPQSELIQDRSVLEKRQEEMAERFKSIDKIPLPDFWGGYEIVPNMVEFWQGRPGRLHDRIRFNKNETDAWAINRLAP